MADRFSRSVTATPTAASDTLDTRPEIKNIIHYAGDTLTIRVTAPASLTDTMTTWLAQIKANRDLDVVAATFDVTTPVISGGPAYLVLPGAVSSALVEGLPVLTVRAPDGTTRAVKQYIGEYDCQISVGGTDPIRTLVQGSIIFEQDVSRVLP